jgi:hypothetical protein
MDNRPQQQPRMERPQPVPQMERRQQQPSPQVSPRENVQPPNNGNGEVNSRSPRRF